MKCPIRSSIEFGCDCPYGACHCLYSIFEDDEYTYELCPYDVSGNGECMATRIHKTTQEIEIVVVKVVS